MDCSFAPKRCTFRRDKFLNRIRIVFCHNNKDKKKVEKMVNYFEGYAHAVAADAFFAGRPDCGM